MKNLKISELKKGMNIIVQFKKPNIINESTEYGIQPVNKGEIDYCLAGEIMSIGVNDISIIGDIYEDKNIEVSKGKFLFRQDDYIIPFTKITGIIENKFVIVLHNDHSGIHSEWFYDDYDSWLDEIDYIEAKEIDYNSYHGTQTKVREHVKQLIKTADEIREHFNNY